MLNDSSLPMGGNESVDLVPQKQCGDRVGRFVDERVKPLRPPVQTK